MGIFANLKKILFEDDVDETESMPVYTDKVEKNDEVVESKENVELQPAVVNEVKSNNDSYFPNVKRDVGFSFEDKDVLDEVNSVQLDKKNDVVSEPIVKREEKSVFQMFDEDEFDRFNSRINKNENKIKMDVKNNSVSSFDARRANSNFSSTTFDNRGNVDKYKLNDVPVKKTFTPSPIISPVYGILDKNYTKDDIVDKKDGLKREKVVKPVHKDVTKTIEEAEKEVEITEKTIVVEKSTPVVDIDSVRKKAYGELEELEKTLTDLKLSEIKEADEELVIENKFEEIDTSVEDELDKKFIVDDIELTENEKELDRVVENVIEDKNRNKPQLLNDLEKTSTLQILDDIEKELNSIKPISRDIEVEDDEEIVQKDESLEKDLFNLIDSMYEEGEEEEDND